MSPTQVNENILEVKNLSKAYDGLEAVRDISFSIAPGEIVGLLGPNGAGKTSTISMILGLLESDAGSIHVFGKDIKTDRTYILNKTNFAAVYAQLPGNMTVRQNLTIFSLLYGVPDYKKRVRAVIEEFNLSKHADTRSGFLSSGELSRLNLAKALINEPRFLLLDEPTSSLDPSATEIAQSHFKRYASSMNAAILWTSHDMNEIEAVCSRVLFLSHGKILLEGDPKKLPGEYQKKNLEELFISLAREPLTTHP